MLTSTESAHKAQSHFDAPCTLRFKRKLVSRPMGSRAGVSGLDFRLRRFRSEPLDLVEFCLVGLRNEQIPSFAEGVSTNKLSAIGAHFCVRHR